MAHRRRLKPAAFHRPGALAMFHGIDSGERGSAAAGATTGALNITSLFVVVGHPGPDGRSWTGAAASAPPDRTLREAKQVRTARPAGAPLVASSATRDAPDGPG